MCSRSCTRVFSEPTYGLKVSFVYVYKTRLLLYKATTLQEPMTLPEIDHVSFLVEHAETFFAGANTRQTLDHVNKKMKNKKQNYNPIQNC